MMYASEDNSNHYSNSNQFKTYSFLAESSVAHCWHMTYIYITFEMLLYLMESAFI